MIRKEKYERLIKKIEKDGNEMNGNKKARATIEKGIHKNKDERDRNNLCVCKSERRIAKRW